MRTDTYDEAKWQLVPREVPRPAYDVLECIEANHSTDLYGSYQAMWDDLLKAVPGGPEAAPPEECDVADGSDFGCPIHRADAERLALLAGGRHVQGGLVFTPAALQNLLLAARCAKDETLRDGCEVCHGERGGIPGNENRVNGQVMCDDCSADAHRAARGALDE